MDLPPDYPGFPPPQVEVRRETLPQVTGSLAEPAPATRTPQERDLWIFLSRYVNGAGFDHLAEKLGLPESDVKQRFDEFCRDLVQDRGDASPPVRMP